MTNGPELRRFRRDNDVTVTALARLLRKSRQTIHTLEGRHLVEDDLAARYVAAVRELATKGNE